MVVRGPTNDYKMFCEHYSSLCKKLVFLLPVAWFHNAEKADFDPDVFSYVVYRGFTISSLLFHPFKKTCIFVVSIFSVII